MKKSTLLSACLLSGAVSVAAAQGMHEKHEGMAKPGVSKTKPAEASVKGCMMKGGKMVTVMSDGTTLPMEKDMMMGGMKMMKDGRCVLKDGSSVMMKEGESMMMDGTMGVMMKDGKMMTMMPGGKMTEMKDDMTMMDGSRVMKDGTCVMRDGATMPMKEGGRMSADGAMKHADTPK